MKDTDMRNERHTSKSKKPSRLKRGKTDITPQRRAAGASVDEKAFTEAALDILQEPFFVFDTAGRFRRWNNTLKSVTGYTDEEISCMNPTGFFPEGEKQRVMEAIDTVMILVCSVYFYID